jgi:outer membrane protein TolC
MRLGTTIVAAILAIALPAATAAAADLLTRDAARTLALRSSRTLQAALLSVDAARLAETADRYGLLPSVSASAGASLSAPRTSLAAAAGGSVGLGVGQVIYDGMLGVQLAIDALDTQVARVEARAEYFRALESVDTAWAGVVEAQSSLDAASSDLEAAQTREALARAKREAGIVIRADLLKAESETAAAETAVAQARGRLSAALAALASLTGLELPVAIDMADPPGTAELTDQLAALTDGQTAELIARLQQVVAAGSPALEKVGLAEEKAAKNRDLARAGGLPGISASLSGQLGLSPAGVDPGASLSLTLSVPLDYWKVQNSVATAETALRRAGLEAGETRRTTRLGVQSAVYDLVSAARTVKSSLKALEYAQGHYESVLERYRLSTVAAAELSDAASLVSTSRSQLISSRSQLLSTLAGLRTMAASESDSLITGLLP